MKQSVSMCVLMILLTAPATVCADKPGPPETYLTYSADKKFVFVMLVKGDKHPLYTQSGMYRNDRSTPPLWTVDWFAWNARYRLAVAADGKHLIRIQTWVPLKKEPGKPKMVDLDQEGLDIFANGKLVRAIKLNEMVDRPERMRRTITSFHWIKKDNLDDGKLTYRVETEDGNRIVLDVATGKFSKEKGTD